jgi:RNA 2',3'-cyclic 3'-phosphodiesterase
MYRLFVAVDLPEAHHVALQQLVDPTLEARWTPSHQAHMTLCFLGDQPEEIVPEVDHALMQVDCDAIMARPAGVNVFPSRRKPRVLFAGIQDGAGLIRLQRDVQEVLSPFVEPDPKPYHPHVTLARLKHPQPRQVRAYLSTHASFQLEPFVVDAFHLYHSQRHPSGALHRRLKSYRLKARLT